MQLKYHKQTDSLYIIFKKGPGVDSYEISTDFITDVDFVELGLKNFTLYSNN